MSSSATSGVSPVDTSLDAQFVRCCLPYGGRPPMLSLLPSLAGAPDSRLALLADHLLRQHGSSDSLAPLAARGLDFVALRSWCSARQRSRQSVLCLVTALSLLQVVERLERLDLRFRLPAGSAIVVFEGVEAGAAGPLPGSLLPRVVERLGVAGTQVVRAYFPPPLPSPIFTEALLDGDPDLFIPPPSLKVHIVDPATLAELPAGESGRVAFAAEDGGEPLLVDELGMAEGAGFRRVVAPTS